MAKVRVRNLCQLVCWITVDNLLTIISPNKNAGFNGILNCRLVVLEVGAASSCLIFLCCAWSTFGSLCALLVGL
jgi:hypothetical protein